MEQGLGFDQDQGQARGHGFQHHQALGFGDRGENEQIGLVQLVHHLGEGHHVGEFDAMGDAQLLGQLLQIPQAGTAPHHHELDAIILLGHPLEHPQQEIQILLFGHASHVNQSNAVGIAERGLFARFELVQVHRRGQNLDRFANPIARQHVHHRGRRGDDVVRPVGVIPDHPPHDLLHDLIVHAQEIVGVFVVHGVEGEHQGNVQLLAEAPGLNAHDDGMMGVDDVQLEAGDHPGDVRRSDHREGVIELGGQGNGGVAEDERLIVFVVAGVGHEHAYEMAGVQQALAIEHDGSHHAVDDGQISVGEHADAHGSLLWQGGWK